MQNALSENVGSVPTYTVFIPPGVKFQQLVSLSKILLPPKGTICDPMCSLDQQKTNSAKNKHTQVYILLQLAKSNHWEIIWVQYPSKQKCNTQVGRSRGGWDGTAPTQSSETSKQPSHFVKSEKTQLSSVLCIKRGTAKYVTELEAVLTRCISIADVE